MRISDNDTSAPVRWDIFCRVVDNYGDIGVTFRLARQLVNEYAIPVRLWLDDLASLQALWPQTSLDAGQQWVQGVEVCRWDDPFVAADPAGVVIEAFACGLPESYLEAMSRQQPVPVWINLEYLSAESWVEGCHAQQSRHPRLPLTQYFFFPGFTSATGGLLRERELLTRCAAFMAAPAEQQDFWQAIEVIPEERELKVSLFAYENNSVSVLLRSWAEGGQRVLALLPQNRLLRDVEQYFGRTLGVGEQVRQGSLRLQVLPFLPQDQYDRLLWSCDLNFVRGEDSFVRAQWAQQAMVWQIYRQEEGAHQPKLDAFLQHYAEGLSAAAAVALQGFWQGWNRQALTQQQWTDYLACLPEYREHARNWATRLSLVDDLAQSLISFCKNRV